MSSTESNSRIIFVLVVASLREIIDMACAQREYASVSLATGEHLFLVKREDGVHCTNGKTFIDDLHQKYTGLCRAHMKMSHNLSDLLDGQTRLS